MPFQPDTFVWVEVWRNEAAMFAHLEHMGGGLAESMAILSHDGPKAILAEPMKVETFGALTEKAEAAATPFGAKMNKRTLGFEMDLGELKKYDAGTVASASTYYRPLIVNAWCKVKPSKRAEFLKVSREIDDLTRTDEAETGM